MNVRSSRGKASRLFAAVIFALVVGRNAILFGDEPSPANASQTAVEAKMETKCLNGVWQVRPERLDCIGEAGLQEVAKAQDGWIAAQVPGEIHLDLMKTGQMPEPTIGTNMPKCRWPETKSWWYRTKFDVTAEFLRFERQQLVFDGLDLYAQVFVNGHLVGEATNAFVPAGFDVKWLLKEGANDLVVRMTVGTELVPDDSWPGQGNRPDKPRFGEIPNPAREGDLYNHRSWYGRKWLRKAQFSYGWDWVDALPNIGIWRGVRLEGRSCAVLSEIRLDTIARTPREGEAPAEPSEVREFADSPAARQEPRPPGITHAYLEMEAVVENLHPWSERACALSLRITPPDGGAVIERRYPLDAFPGRTPIRDVIEVADPKLWWPNGMGDQPLYNVTAEVVDQGGTVFDRRQFNIGLRTIELDRSHVPEGSRFCFRVNRQDVFCHGGNLGPQDAILARISAEKYEKLVAEAKAANVNMFRINGCSIYEGPAFYDACDRAGIMIFHDFMLTDTSYPDDAKFNAVVVAETEAVVRQLRHHASIALWSGNNECFMGFRDWWNPDKSKRMDLGGWRLYNQLLPDVCRHLDPRRPYIPGSPVGGMDANSEMSGDCHWWSATMSGDMNRRIHHQPYDQCRSRFNSEYGIIGPCHMDSIREYLLPEEVKRDSLAWRIHTNQFETNTGNTVPAAIHLHYADPDNLSVPEYVLYGQMFQMFLHEHAMEALRFRTNDPVADCHGALIWSFSDCWGETGWSVLDYYLRRKPSYYGFRRACAPVKVITRQRDDRLITRVVNDTLAPVAGKVEYGWWRLDGGGRDVESKEVTVPANGMLEVASDKMAGERDAKQWLYASVLRTNDVPVDQSVWLLEPFRKLDVKTPQIKMVGTDDGGLEISSPVYAHAVHVEDHGHELISNNWFDLLPGVPIRVRLAPGVKPESIHLDAVTAK
jgi:beta-mannosidase